MNKDEFITQFDEYVARSSERRERSKGLPSLFDATPEDLADTYMPGETEKPTTDMSLESILSWLIRRSFFVFNNNASAARNWFFIPHQQIRAKPIDLISTQEGAIKAFNALPERYTDKQWLNDKPEGEEGI